MKLGTIYGIGVGPGDPELITLKGAGYWGSAGRSSSPRPGGRGTARPYPLPEAICGPMLKSMNWCSP